MASWHRDLVRDIMFDLITTVNASSERGTGKFVKTFLETFCHDPTRPTLPALQKNDPISWFAFLQYYSVQEAFRPIAESQYREAMKLYRENKTGAPLPKPVLQFPSEERWRQFSAYASMISTAFQNMVSRIEEQNCKIEFLFTFRLPNSYFEQCWIDLELQEPYSKIMSLKDECEAIASRIDRYKELYNVLFPKTALLESLIRFESSYTNYTPPQVRTFFNLQNNEKHQEFLLEMETPALPLALTKAADWLRVMSKSKLFLHFWFEAEHLAPAERILSISQHIKSIYDSLKIGRAHV